MNIFKLCVVNEFFIFIFILIINRCDYPSCRFARLRTPVGLEPERKKKRSDLDGLSLSPQVKSIIIGLTKTLFTPHNKWLRETKIKTNCLGFVWYVLCLRFVKPVRNSRNVNYYLFILRRVGVLVVIM